MSESDVWRHIFPYYTHHYNIILTMVINSSYGKKTNIEWDKVGYLP